MPGCLGLDALWQMLGFFLGWVGGQGRGRALGVGEVKLTGMVTPAVKRLEYIVDLKRVIRRKLTLGIADGLVKADGDYDLHRQGSARRAFGGPIRADRRRQRLKTRGPMRGVPKDRVRNNRGFHETRRGYRLGHRVLDRQ